jgi:hypothetical protein
MEIGAISNRLISNLLLIFTICGVRYAHKHSPFIFQLASICFFSRPNNISSRIRPITC